MIKRVLGKPLIQSVLLAALVLAGMLWHTPPLVLLENIHFDYWADRFRAPDSSPIAIVAIDEDSVRRTGDWPWPRHRVAELVQRLSAAGADALGICLLFTQPELNPGRSEIEALKAELTEQEFKGGRKTTSILTRLLDRSEQRLNHDDQLISAIRRARNTVLPFLFSFDMDEGGAEEKPPGLLIINSLKPPAKSDQERPALMAEAASFHKKVGTSAASGVRSTFAELAGKAGALGHINLRTDPDGTVRRLPLFIDYGGRLYPSLALQLALKSRGISVRELTIRHDVYGRPQIEAGFMRLPTDENYHIMLNVDPEWTAERTFSVADVMDDGLDTANLFKDKIVLVGLTDPYLAPTFRIGGHDGFSMVEITANALARILSPD